MPSKPKTNGMQEMKEMQPMQDAPIGSANTSIIINGINYNFCSTLGGRGQIGCAGFYTSVNADPEQLTTVLVKEDKPGTCLAEGMAIIYTPPGQQKMDESIIQASVGIVLRDGVSTVASIQARYSPAQNEEIMPFDIYLLGHKRDPNTFSSEESRNKSAITEKISKLPVDVKMQLANAIYTSQLNGDESLHTGQFMISINKSQDVSSIRRIDFGALGRYGLARDQFDPLHTSSQYARSGQLFKDYVSYLLDDETVRKRVLKLWATTNTVDVVNAVGERFDNQVACLDAPFKDNALKEFDLELTKKSSFTLSGVNDIQKQVRDHLIRATRSRCNGMKESAILTISDWSHRIAAQRAFKDAAQDLRLEKVTRCHPTTGKSTRPP